MRIKTNTFKTIIHENRLLDGKNARWLKKDFECKECLFYINCFFLCCAIGDIIVLISINNSGLDQRV